jgi:hypothetical protein
MGRRGIMTKEKGREPTEDLLYFFAVILWRDVE